MRSVSAVAAFSGPIVAVGYLVGSLTATWLNPDDRRPSDVLVEVFVALASSTAAWWTIQELSPGSSFSRIGYLSNQVLSAWQSVALWTGLAVVTGLCAPVFRRFRGGTGLAASAALLLIHFPWSLAGSEVGPRESRRSDRRAVAGGRARLGPGVGTELGLAAGPGGERVGHGAHDRAGRALVERRRF